MKRIRFLAAAAALLIASTASAVTLDKSFVGQPFIDTALTGTTAALRPELALGTIIADVSTAFSYAALNISGTVQSRVVRENGTGTLDFYWRIIMDDSSTGGGIQALRLTDFGYDNIVDADFRTDGLGSAGPETARVFDPLLQPGGSINFVFADPGLASGSSYFFFLRTSATNYAETALFDLLAGTSQALSPSFSTFAPAEVPEPSTYMLMIAGLLGLGYIARRRAAA